MKEKPKEIRCLLETLEGFKKVVTQKELTPTVYIPFTRGNWKDGKFVRMEGIAQGIRFAFVEYDDKLNAAYYKEPSILPDLEHLGDR